MERKIIAERNKGQVVLSVGMFYMRDPDGKLDVSIYVEVRQALNI
jgi:hypothetical protein